MKNNIKIQELKKFGLIFGIGLPIFLGLIIPIIASHNFKFWPFYIGLIIILLSFIKPVLLHYPYKVWMFIGQILGWINSHIILGLIFILLLIPISFIMKIFGYDPLKLNLNDKLSYREDTKDSKVNFTRIF